MTLSDASSKQILMIEDDPNIREALSEILQFEGYHVQCVKNGKEGLDYLSNSPPPSLILLDYMMPVMDGKQFLSIQKEDPYLSQIPVVLLSADLSASQFVQNFKTVKFLKKPIEFDQLLKFIQQMS